MRSPRRAAAIGAGCVAVAIAVAVALLAVPATLAYDPWAWLVWGRQVTGLDLDTTGGPSWKPGPTLAAVAVVPFGGLAPTAWLVLARTLAFVGLVGVFRLAQRLAGSVVAGVVAVALLVLTPDAGPRFVRMVLEGHSAPVTAGLTAWAVERHLAGRPRATLWSLVALSLDRPEAWPFLGGYAVWAWRQRRVAPIELATALALVPVLWFGGDWWGSGSPRHGADAATDLPGELEEVGGALRRAFESVIAPVWLASLAGTVAWAWRRSRAGAAARTSGPLGGVAALTALGLAWCAVVLAMHASFGFAALSRFFLPGATLLCVAAAVAAVEAVRAVPSPAWRPVAAVAAVVVVLPSAAGRTSNLRGTLEEAADRRRADDALAELIADEGGAAAVRACAPLSIDTSDVPRPALAWRADVPLRDVRRTPDPPQGTMVLRTDGDAVWVVRHGACQP